MIIALLLLAAMESQAPALPVPVEIRVPEYPESAVKAHITGVVEVTLTVSPDGSVTDAVSAPGAPPLINTEAVRAAREWRFQGAAAGSGARPYVVRFEFSVGETPATKDEHCFVGPTSATILIPQQTVRIRGWVRGTRTTT